jgi:iron complex outermembrane receptor protein
MLQKYIFLTLYLLAAALFTDAQQCDSACGAGSCCCTRPVYLNAVVVSCNAAVNNPQFNFYKQNKLPTTEEILGRMPGVSLIRRGNYGMEAGLRCYCGGQINTTINGMKIFGACTDKMDPVSIYIEPNNLNTINVSQGAGGCKYGSTIGGSMDMDIKEAQCTPLREIYFTTASSYSSGNNGYSGNVSLTSSGPRASFRIGLVYRKAQDYREGGGAVVPYSGYEKANLTASASFAVRPRQMLVLDYIGDMGWNIGFPALVMDTRRARANIASASFSTSPGRKILKHTETKAYFNYIYHLMDNSQRTDIPMQMSMPGWSSTGGIYTDMNLALGKNNELELRADYYANYTKASMTMFPENAPVMYMLTLPDNLRQFAGVFANDEWHIAPAHILSVNARNEIMHTDLLSTAGREQWDVFTDSTTTTKLLPSGSVKYSWLSTAHISLSLTGAYGTSAPSGNQLYGYYLFTALDNYDYIGNPALKSEKALQGDVSLNYQDKIVNLSVTGYYHRLYDYIIGTVLNGYSPVTYGATGVKEYVNMPGAFITGADVSAGINLKQGIQLQNTFNYSYGSLSNGSAVPLLSPLRGINSGRYTFKGWHIQAETDWALAKNRVNESVGEITSPAYALLNLRTGYQFMFRNHIWDVNFSVENVLDERYREYSDWGTVLRPGRNFIVYISYSFGKSREAH